MTNLTKEQTNHELTKIRRNALTLNEYIRLSRVGETFSMTRADRKEVYALYLAECEKNDNNRRKKAISKAGQSAYNAITKHRDEVMLVTA